MNLTAVLAEDETLLRQFLKKKLEKLWPELSVVGEAEHGLAAVELINTLKPTVAFLDIRMPELTGLEVASKIAGWNDDIFGSGASRADSGQQCAKSHQDVVGSTRIPATEHQCSAFCAVTGCARTFFTSSAVMRPPGLLQLLRT